MTKAQLIASRTLWRSREIYRYRRWRYYAKRKAEADPLRKKWYDLWSAAHELRLRRDNQISKYEITHIDSKGIDFIAQEEGVIPYAYNDSRGFATAWIGHLIAMRPVNAGDLKKWGSRSNPAPLDKVKAYFRYDVAPYEKAVRAVWAKAIKNGHKGPTQEQFNADVCFCFNIGIGGFQSSTHAVLIANGAPKKDAADAMLKWNKPAEIQGRRQREHTLWLEGKYTKH